MTSVCPTGYRRRALYAACPEHAASTYAASLVETQPAASQKLLDSIFESAPLQKLLPALHAHPLLTRGLKDAALINAIGELLSRVTGGQLLNPCCVFARHARTLARLLPHVRVLASDIDNCWMRCFSVWERVTWRSAPSNLECTTASVYDLPSHFNALGLCVFGACGSLADAAMDLAIASRARLLVLRACCHENVGGNFRMDRVRPTIWSAGNWIKNRIYAHQAARHGFYIHPRYAAERYPRSQLFREHIDSVTLLGYARNAVDCSACRAVIDLDRAAWMEEHSYEILACGASMVIARRIDQ